MTPSSTTSADNTDNTIRVFLLDDHELVRNGIAELINSTDGLEVVGEAATAASALSRVLACRPDVAILDMQLPDGTGIEVCRDIRSQLTDTYCLILTSFDDHDAVLASVLAGASGYLLKQIRIGGLVDAIRQVAMGRSLIDPAVLAQVMNKIRDAEAVDPRLRGLTERERQVLDLITDGLTNRQIGERLYLTEKTVKNYASSLFAKLGLERRSQAAVFGAQLRAKSPGHA